MSRKGKDSGSIFDVLDADDEFEAELKRNAALPAEAALEGKEAQA